jgi:hypothetical protein
MIATLLDPALRAIAMAAVLWLGLKLLRLHNPHVQLTIWTFALAASLLMPAATRIASAVVPPAPILAPVEVFPGFPELERGARGDDVLATFVDSQHRPPQATGLGARAEFIVSVVYWGVAGVFLLRIAAGLLLTGRLVRAAKPLDERWAVGWDIRVSGEISTAATFGETILLPQDHVHWSTAKRCAVLAHEIEHARRGDFYIQIAAMINRAIFWFSPLSWWLQHRLSLLVEAVSDDAALVVIKDRPFYAEILLEFSRRRQIGLAAVSMARPATVRARIDRVLIESSVHRNIGKRARAILISTTLLIAAIASMPLAAPLSSSRQDDGAGFERPAWKQIADDLTFRASDASMTDNSTKNLQAGAAPSNFGEDPTTISPQREQVLEPANGVVSSGADHSVSPADAVPAPQERIAAIDANSPKNVYEGGRPTRQAESRRLRRLEGKAKAPITDLSLEKLIRQPVEQQPNPGPATSLVPSFPSSTPTVCVDKSWTHDPGEQHAFYICRDQRLKNIDVSFSPEWPSNPTQLGTAAYGASGPSLCFDRRWTAGDPAGQRAFYVCSKS